MLSCTVKTQNNQGKCNEGLKHSEIKKNLNSNWRMIYASRTVFFFFFSFCPMQNPTCSPLLDHIPPVENLCLAGMFFLSTVTTNVI